MSLRRLFFKRRRDEYKAALADMCETLASPSMNRMLGPVAPELQSVIDQAAALISAVSKSGGKIQSLRMNAEDVGRLFSGPMKTAYLCGYPIALDSEAPPGSMFAKLKGGSRFHCLPKQKEVL